MYQVLNIIEHAVTRVVELQNIVTGTKDSCFDDSALVSDNNNFKFMEVGELYDCKIDILGKPVKTESYKSFRCEITNKNIKIGNTEFVEVLVKGNVYYTLNLQFECLNVGDQFLFECSRKDLIMVDSIVHEDLK